METKRTQMTDTLTTSPPPAPVTEAWTNLEEHCAEALSVSREVLTRLEAGAQATDLLPLLQQECDAMTSVGADIALFAGRLPANGAPRRDEIAAKLAELVQVDKLSRDLLSRRGVQLRTGRRWEPKQRFAAVRVPVQGKQG